MKKRKSFQYNPKLHAATILLYTLKFWFIKIYKFNHSVKYYILNIQTKKLLINSQNIETLENKSVL